MVQAVSKSTTGDLNWEAVKTDLHTHQSVGWFTSKNYHIYFSLHELAADIQSDYEEIVSLREDLLDQNRITGDRRWDRLTRRSCEREARILLDLINSLTDSVRNTIRLLSNTNVTVYNSVKTYIGRSHISLSNVNNTVDEHPENRKEYCKVRLEYIQWCLTSTWSEQITKEMLEPYLDGGGIDEGELRSWLMKYEREVSTFLKWLHGFFQDVIENLATGLSDRANRVKSELMQASWDEGNANWRDVTQVCERMMNEPDIDEFLETLHELHEHGGPERDYLGLKVWVENEEEIEHWESNFDDDYDGAKAHLDPDRPEPELRVEILRSNEWERRDELVDDWSEIEEWSDELQLDAPDEPEEATNPEPTNQTPESDSGNDVDDIIDPLKRAGVFESMEGPAEDFERAYRAVLEGNESAEGVAGEMNCPVPIAEKYLDKLVGENLLDRVDDGDTYLP